MIHGTALPAREIVARASAIQDALARWCLAWSRRLRGFDPGASGVLEALANEAEERRAELIGVATETLGVPPEEPARRASRSLFRLRGRRIRENDPVSLDQGMALAVLERAQVLRRRIKRYLERCLRMASEPQLRETFAALVRREHDLAEALEDAVERYRNPIPASR